LIRIPPVFAGFTTEILRSLGVAAGKPLGADYRLVKLAEPRMLHDSEAAKFVQWNLPVDHAWPCSPTKIGGFVEKAAGALAAKFADSGAQAVLVGALDAGSPNRYFRTLASNLRGRMLQLFPAEVAGCSAEDQDPQRPTLFCLVGKEGVYGGLQSPRASGGFHPGGTKFIRQGGSDTISRAGAKIAEALHVLALHRAVPPAGSRWLELGASPGGMTSELLRRGYLVTAVDRAPLDGRLDGSPGLVFVRDDVARFTPPRDSIAGILCDLNGPARVSIGHVARMAGRLAEGGLVVFTLKAAGASTYEEINVLFAETVALADAAGLRLLGAQHLTYNRKEFTLYFCR
jgi:23S rRNA (cytidine2498-2'-O)-methyltransferase